MRVSVANERHLAGVALTMHEELETFRRIPLL